MSTALARLVGLLCLYIAARFALFGHLDAPTFGWRPTDLASIAINYYRNGFHFAYPQVMWGGAGVGHVEMEFPLQPFVTALLFKVVGLHDWVCLVLPLSFGFGLVLVVEKLGRYLFGPVAGFAAGASVAVSPTLLYITTTGMWADPPMVFCGTAGLYLLTRWADDGNARRLWAGVACVALAILFKLSALYLGVTVVYLFARRYGWAFVKKPVTWVAAAAMLVPPALWYAHSYGLFLEEGNTFGIIGGGYLKFPTPEILGDASVYKRALVRIVIDHLTPLSFLAFAYGLFLAVKVRHALLLVWYGSVVLHSFVVLGGIRYGGHVGYLLPILPICNLLGAQGVRCLLDASRERASHGWLRAARAPLCVGLGLGLLTSAAFGVRQLYGRDLAFETAIWEKKRETGVEVGRVTRPGALIVVLDDEMDSVDEAHSMTPPDVFFYSDRRGWYSSLAWFTTEKLEAMRAQGAEYLVVSLQSIAKFESAHPDVYEYVNRHFRRVTPTGTVYALALTGS